MTRTAILMAAAAALLVPILGPAGAEADVLFNFTGKTTGAQPIGGVIFDADGNLYGTTNSGGAHQNDGTVYKLTPNGKETILHSFSLCPASGNCVEGNSPQGSLLIDANGNLIGTAASGGAPGCLAGTVFSLAPDGTETTLHSFCPKGNARDGEHPHGGVVMDGAGNLYGITAEGGANGFGSVYQLLAPDYTAYNLIYSFCSQGSTRCTDGSLPSAGIQPAPGVVIDGDGNLYGTTSQDGGSGAGTVWELSPTGTGKYKLTVLYNFSGRGGAAPNAGLVLDGAGNIYGTTAMGGSGHRGVLFELSPNGKGFAETVLYNFCSQNNCTDGAGATGSLIADSAGILYGAAAKGGAHNGGVVFSFDPNAGAYSVLYDFCAQAKCADGQAPMAIASDGAGNLFGTTEQGGSNKMGTVFELVGVVANP